MHKQERKDIVEYTLIPHSNQHISIQLLGTNDEKKTFGEKGKSLELGHILAWHKIRKTNVIVFQYDVERDLIKQQARHINEQYVNNGLTCCLLYDDIGSGHFDYIETTPQSQLPQFVDVAGLPKIRYNMLDEFDEKNNVAHVMIVKNIKDICTKIFTRQRIGQVHQTKILEIVNRRVGVNLRMSELKIILRRLFEDNFIFYIDPMVHQL